jgi:NADH dehydrogenase [ubiquinone] 1 alpha subcomplex assembly factor 7
MLRFLPKRLHQRFRSLTVTQYRPFVASAQRFSTAVLPVTPVEKLILDHVKVSKFSPLTRVAGLKEGKLQAIGPMSYATYMQFCLAHPTEGYYMKSSNEVFGSRGDFITSPDISQIFGEVCVDG